MESSWSDGDCRNIDDYYKYAEHDVKANEGKKDAWPHNEL